jgi:hypothetical protein
MRSVILSLVLGVATLGFVGMTPSSAEAQWRRGYRYNPTYDNLQSIYNYHYSIQNYGPFGAPYGYTGNYGYNYNYGYNPGYYNYSYGPGGYSYYYQAPAYGYYYSPRGYYGY